MFTGIIEEIGTVLMTGEVDGGWVMQISAEKVLQGTKLGDSIAVNGTCLTVTEMSETHFTMGVAPETLRRTNLGDLKVGDVVNLERSLPANGRMDGHFVQGHVDGTGVIRAMRRDGDSLWVEVSLSAELMRYIIVKGYLAIDGTSLTVVDVWEDGFSFMLIAYTQEKIVIARKKVGDRLNIEVDMMGKYIEKLLAVRFNG